MMNSSCLEWLVGRENVIDAIMILGYFLKLVELANQKTLEAVKGYFKKLLRRNC